MADFAASNSQRLLDVSVSVEAILRTEELNRRPSRPLNYERENQALLGLARTLVNNADVLQLLAQEILAIVQCDSAGVSLLTNNDGGKHFLWRGIAGIWNLGSIVATPRDCSPCGDVLDRNHALLFHRFERRYTLFQPVMPPAEECLIVPFYLNGAAAGAMCAVMHSDRRGFDAEDARLMTALGQFAACAYQALESLRDLKVQLASQVEENRALRREAAGAGQQVRSMIDAALDAAVMMNERGLITDWNPQAEVVFGWKRDEALGRRLSHTIIPEQYRDAHERGLRHFLESGEGAVLNRRIEMTALRRSGELFPVELTVTALRISESWSFHAFLRDITDRKAAEEALRASERNLDLIINTIPTLAWSARSDGSRDFFNRHFQKYCGLSLEQLRGWGWKGAIHPDDLPGVMAYWHSMIQTGTPGEYEARFKRFDGAYRWFLIRVQPLRDGAGAIVKWYGTNTDIEDRKQADEALRDTQARLTRATQFATGGQMAASIAHEINQPLAAVVASANACLRFLSAEPPNLARAREAAASIVRDGKDAGEVVRRVRALFKRAPVERSMVHLSDVIREVLRLLSHEISRLNVTVETEISNECPPVSCDRVQLQQVVLNLLMNALEAVGSISDRPRKVRMHSRRQGPRLVQVEITDNGMGFEEPGKMFEPFFTTKEDGMGMGLAICRSIVDEHGGRLWAAQPEGPGATFCFVLPVETGAAV